MTTALILALLAAAPQTPHDPVLAAPDGRTACTTMRSHVPAGKTASGPTVICRADATAPSSQSVDERDEREKRGDRRTGA